MTNSLQEPPDTRERSLIASRAITRAGDCVWENGYALFVFLASGEPASVFLVQCLIYFIRSAAPAVFPRLLAAPNPRRIALLTIASQSALLVVCGGCMWAFMNSEEQGVGNPLFVGASLASALLLVLGQLTAGLVETRLAVALSPDSSNSEVLVKSITASLPAVDSLVFFVYSVALLATAQTPISEALPIWLLCMLSVNLVSFAAEGVLLARSTPANVPGIEESQSATLSAVARLNRAHLALPLVASAFIWLTVLYPGPIISASLQTLSGGQEAALWMTYALWSVSSAIGALGGLYVVRRTRPPAVWTSGQALCLVAACILLTLGYPLAFAGLLVCSRFFLFAYWGSIRAFIATRGPGVSQLAFSVETALANVSQFIVLALGFVFTTGVETSVFGSRFTAMAWLSTGSIATSAALWAIYWSRDGRGRPRD